jgi:hypothetical protein
MQTKHLVLVGLGLIAGWTEAGKPQVCFPQKTTTTTIYPGSLATGAAEGQQIEIVQGGGSSGSSGSSGSKGSSGSSGSGSKGSGSSGSESSGYEIIGSGGSGSSGSGSSGSSGSYGSSGSKGWSGSSSDDGSGLGWYDNYEPVLGGPYESWGGGAATAYGNGNFKDYLSIGYYDCNSYGYTSSKTKAPAPWSQPTSAAAGPTNRYPPKASYRSYGWGNGSYYSQPTTIPSSKPTPAPSSTRSYPSARPSSTGYCVNSPSNRQCWGQYNIDTDYNQVIPDTGVTQEVCRPSSQADSSTGSRLKMSPWRQMVMNGPCLSSMANTPDPR